MGHTVEALKNLQVPSELLQIKLYLAFCKPTLREIKHNEKQVDGCSIFYVAHIYVPKIIQ